MTQHFFSLSSIKIIILYACLGILMSSIFETRNQYFKHRSVLFTKSGYRPSSSYTILFGVLRGTPKKRLQAINMHLFYVIQSHSSPDLRCIRQYRLNLNIKNLKKTSVLSYHLASSRLYIIEKLPSCLLLQKRKFLLCNFIVNVKPKYV